MMTDEPSTTEEVHASGCSTTRTLEAVLDAADSVLVVVLDREMRIRRASTGVCALLGWAPAQVVGRSYASLFGEDEAAAGADALQPAQVTGRARLRTREGFSQAVRLTSTAVHDSRGRVTGTVVVAVEAALRVERHGATTAASSTARATGCCDQR